MSSNCKRCSEIISQKLFRLINILIDLIFGIFHYFMKQEDWYLRYASVVKFISTAIFNALDAFQIRCLCCCGSNQSSKEEELDEEDVEKQINKKLDALKLKKKLLIKLHNEVNKSNKKYLDIVSKVKEIKELKKEIKEKIEVIIA